MAKSEIPESTKVAITAGVIAGLSLEIIAERSGVSVHVARSFIQSPESRTLYRQITECVSEAGIARLITGIPDAVDTLLAICNDPNEKTGDRIKASVALLEYGGRALQYQQMHGGSAGYVLGDDTIQDSDIETLLARAAQSAAAHTLPPIPSHGPLSIASGEDIDGEWIDSGSMAS